MYIQWSLWEFNNNQAMITVRSQNLLADKDLCCSPGLELKGPLLSRHLEGVWVVFIDGRMDLHAVNPNPAADSEPLPNQAKLCRATQQEVVELSGGK